ncbi:ABC transporter permease subunit [Aliiglaciecola sp. NS0011-25]|uniref:ABC transporter permease subunit n=1 Tax=Aliiglaciecola sp. NS0011-25 TaxID=3127654 RepID=UPI003106BE03
MLLSNVKQEIVIQFREQRFFLASGILLMLVVVAGITGWTQFNSAENAREEFVTSAQNQWLTQGERHPHRAAHFGVYVVKPETQLAFFEPGLRPFIGQTLWLNAHDRPVFTNIPAEDDLTLGVGIGVASGASVLQMLASLLVLVVGALSVVRDRETGVLRQILSQGVSPTTWVFSKLISLFVVTLMPLFILGLAVTLLALVLQSGMHIDDTFYRTIGLLFSNLLFLLALLAVAVSISSVCSSSRKALLMVLVFWLFGCVLAPRLASSLTTTIAPVPTLDAYQKSVGELFNNGIDARGGYGEQLTALRESTLNKYNVTSVDDLPIGFSGLRMKHLNTWGAEVDDIEYQKLTQLYAKQNQIRTALSLIAPFMAARSVSQSMAGMDWIHYRHFLNAAETYRRDFGNHMDTILENEVHGDAWEMNGDFSDWSTVSPFEYDAPSVSWALQSQIVSVLILLLWALCALTVLFFSSRRMTP